MIKHVVLFAFKKIGEDKIAEVFTKLGNLRKTIPEIKSFSWGKNKTATPFDRGFNYGMEIEFTSMQALETYLNHPDHHKLVDEIILPTLVNGIDSILAFDYDYTT